MNWQDKTTVRKGNVGEDALDRWLRENNYIPYTPPTEGAHPFDRLCATSDKKTIFVADAKAKPARKYYPDTGIDIRHYQEYLHLSEKYRLSVLLVFVDQNQKRMYGNFLRVLDKPRGTIVRYPLEDGGIRYWPLEAMRHIGTLTDEEVEALKKYSTNKPAYDPRGKAA